MNNLLIKYSKIEGKGVFADKNFKTGKTVINWEPCITPLTSEEINQLPKTEKNFVQNNTLLQSPSRFLNHSCNANVMTAEGRYIAIQDIKQGEEITCNYIVEKVITLDMKCNCGSKDCIKLIKSTLF